MTQLPTFSDGTPQQPTTKQPLIVFEGIDASGKTTISMAVSKHFNAWWSHEPHLYYDEIDGSTTPGEKALLFAADRAFHCELLEATLNNKSNRQMCIVDRYYFSNIVYQHIIDNLPLHWLYNIQPLNLIKPSIIFFCTCDPTVAHKRCISKGDPWSIKQLSALQDFYRQAFFPYQFIEIDTTNQSIDDCVSQCITKIEEYRQ